jgi:hypothetical protein
MRNDARPLGEDAHTKSPIDEHDSVTQNRQSHIVNRHAEEDAPRERDDAEDKVLPADDSTLNTKI